MTQGGAMKIRTGCDIVNIVKFKKLAQKEDSRFLERLFSSCELSGAPSVETFAGMFAAKEAVVKALGLKAGGWHEMEILKDEDGHPQVKFLNDGKKITDCDISISHDGEYAMATAVFLFDNI